MKAILLAAGYGTRLWPLTKNIPKCLLPIKGIPLLAIWLEKLKLVGISHVLINSHYLSEQVNEFIKLNGWSAFSTVAFEKKLLGTAGTLAENIEFFGEEDGILIHADNFSNEGLGGLIQAHKTRPEKCVITMLTFRTNNPTSCGIVQIDKEGVVVSFEEKPNSPKGNLANGAIYVLSKEFIKKYTQDFSKSKDFSKDVIPQLVGKIYTYNANELFMDIGTHDAYKYLNEL